MPYKMSLGDKAIRSFLYRRGIPDYSVPEDVEAAVQEAVDFDKVLKTYGSADYDSEKQEDLPLALNALRLIARKHSLQFAQWVADGVLSERSIGSLTLGTGANPLIPGTLDILLGSEILGSEIEEVRRRAEWHDRIYRKEGYRR